MPIRSWLCGFLMLAGFGFSAENLDLWLRFPLQISSTPAWIQEVKTEDLTGYEIFEAKITSPNPSLSCAITFYFTEKELGFLRVFWVTPEGETKTLSANLYEGTGLQNQRTVLLPSDLLTSPGGTLFVQSDQPQLNLQAISFQWTLNKSVSTSAYLSEVPRLLLPHAHLREDEIYGQPPLAKPDSVDQTVSTINLTPQAESSDNTSAYGLELVQIPSRARLELEIQGLPVNIPLTLVINQEIVGEISVYAPSLTDPGYLSKQADYWGWRKASIWVPVEKLHLGLNTVQILSPQTSPLAIKNLILETDFSGTPPVE